MISVNSSLKQSEIIALLESDADSEFHFRFKQKVGLQLHFAVDGDSTEAAKYAKAKIKSAAWAGALFLQVVPL